MSVTVSIDIGSVISDIKVKSFMNTERIADPVQRYAVRASEENEAEIRQGVQHAWNALRALCRKFLSRTTDTSGDSDLWNSFTGDKTLVFDITARRTSNFAEPLAEAAHEFLVAGTLRRFYTSAAMGDLATAYATDERAAADRSTAIIYKKDEPIYT